jgi:hypothetical protein
MHPKATSRAAMTMPTMAPPFKLVFDADRFATGSVEAGLKFPGSELPLGATEKLSEGPG